MRELSLVGIQEGYPKERINKKVDELKVNKIIKKNIEKARITYEEMNVNKPGHP